MSPIRCSVHADGVTFRARQVGILAFTRERCFRICTFVVNTQVLVRTCTGITENTMTRRDRAGGLAFAHFLHFFERIGGVAVSIRSRAVRARGSIMSPIRRCVHAYRLTSWTRKRFTTAFACDVFVFISDRQDWFLCAAFCSLNGHADWCVSNTVHEGN